MIAAVTSVCFVWLRAKSHVSAGQQHSLADATINQTTQYTYDHLYRLTGEGPTSYSYDPVGNRGSMLQAGTTTNYTYDKADRITAAGSTSYTVNSDGNLTARGPDSFSYDQANRLTSATVGGTTSSYAYDGRGKRATKTVSSTTTNYVYDANRRLPVVLDDGTRKYVYGHGLAYATDENGNVQAVYHGDGLRSVRALTDSGANQTGLYRRDAWGVQTTTQGTSTQPFGYTGQLRDTETGLLNLRARMYDPASGRFVQRDTFGGMRGAPRSLNRYAYATDNPVKREGPQWAVCSVGHRRGSSRGRWDRFGGARMGPSRHSQLVGSGGSRRCWRYWACCRCSNRSNRHGRSRCDWRQWVGRRGHQRCCTGRGKRSVR